MNKLISLLLVLALALGGFYFLSKTFKDTKEEYVDVKEESTTPKLANKNKTNKTNVSDANSKPQATGVKNQVNSNYSPAIWKIEHNGKTSYLFGSIHVGNKSMYPLPDKVMSAFASTEALAVEADISNVNQIEMARMIQELALDEENPLPTVLSAKTKEKYDAFCEKKSMTCKMVERFEPWMAAMTIEAFGIIELGYSEALGIDKFFINGAQNKEVVELESIEGQLNLLDQMPKELQDYMMFGAVIKEPSDFKELVAAWRTGQLEALLEKAEEETLAMGIPENVMNEFNDIFLYKRNQVMADGIADLINQGKSVFAVVGAAHYAGKNSVNQYLEEKGFKIERM